ncbi:hypothetical protein F4819DRAFT_422856 [Hypoxylon fuscum]|nr:hypothetical protein F4819DRAFT_422856 [Hypoxylon fuscum]
MEYPDGIPRDQRVAWTSYGRAPLSSTQSHRETWSGYSQSSDYQSAGSGNGGSISYRRDEDSADKSYHQLPLVAWKPEDSVSDPWAQHGASQRRTHRSLKYETESSRGSSSHLGGSRRRQKDATYSSRRSERNEPPEAPDGTLSKYWKDSRNANRDSDAGSHPRRGHAHHTSKHSNPMPAGTPETHDEGRYQTSHKSKHRVPSPPKAPKIPRLPTPDFDDEDYGDHDLASHEFCACCNPDGGFKSGSRRGECTVAKMERQLYNARTYISRNDPHTR